MFKPGDKVTYRPEHYLTDPDKWEHGIVKSVCPDGQAFFVVYHWGEDWRKYRNYTGARTNERDLVEGWLDRETYKLFAPKGERIK